MGGGMVPEADQCIVILSSWVPNVAFFAGDSFVSALFLYLFYAPLKRHTDMVITEKTSQEKLKEVARRNLKLTAIMVFSTGTINLLFSLMGGFYNNDLAIWRLLGIFSYTGVDIDLLTNWTCILAMTNAWRNSRSGLDT